MGVGVRRPTNPDRAYFRSRIPQFCLGNHRVEGAHESIERDTFRRNRFGCVSRAGRPESGGGPMRSRAVQKRQSCGAKAPAKPVQLRRLCSRAGQRRQLRVARGKWALVCNCGARVGGL